MWPHLSLYKVSSRLKSTGPQLCRYNWLPLVASRPLKKHVPHCNPKWFFFRQVNWWKNLFFLKKRQNCTHPPFSHLQPYPHPTPSYNSVRSIIMFLFWPLVRIHIHWLMFWRCIKFHCSRHHINMTYNYTGLLMLFSETIKTFCLLPFQASWRQYKCQASRIANLYGMNETRMCMTAFSIFLISLLVSPYRNATNDENGGFYAKANFKKK